MADELGPPDVAAVGPLPPGAVVELLTFSVAAADRAEWLAVEAEVWSRFLAAQPGFIAKQMWVPDDDADTVMAVIWWASMEQWKSIGPDTVADVDAAMGPWLREPACRAFHVVRTY